MTRPMASQMKKRSQVLAGRPAISRMQKKTLRMGMTRAEGDAEAAMAVGVLVAQDDDSGGDKDEGEEGADVRHLGEGAHVEEAGGDGDQEARDPGGEGGRAEARMDAAEDVGQQAVARHGEPDARLAELKDQDRRDHSDQRAEQHGEADEVQAMSAGQQRDAAECVDHGRGVSGDRTPRNDSGEHHGDADVEQRADDERGEDPDGDVAARVAALFAGCGDGVESDVGEEDDGAAGENAGPSVGREGVVVRGMDEAGAEADEEQDGGDLDQHHDVVGARGFADAADENDGEDEDDEEGGNVEAGVPSGSVDGVAGEVLQAERKVGGREPLGREMQAQPVEQIDDVRGEADADAHVGEGVFEDEVPADDPRDQLAHGGVGVGVGGAGDGDHAGQLGVAEAGERADDGDQHQRERDGWARAGTARDGAAGVMQQAEDEVDDGRVGPLGQRGGIAADGDADDGEDARADDGADAERGERDRAERFAQGAVWPLRIGDQLVDGLGGEDLPGQRRTPARSEVRAAFGERRTSQTRATASPRLLQNASAWSCRVRPS